MKFETALRTSMATEILNRLQAGTAQAPKLQIYSGAMPANIGDAIAGTLLAELDIATTVGTVTDGVLTFDAITDDASANASGDPTWARLLNRDGIEIIYLTASASGAGGELQVNPGSIVSGETVSASLGIIRAGV